MLLCWSARLVHIHQSLAVLHTHTLVLLLLGCTCDWSFQLLNYMDGAQSEPGSQRCGKVAWSLRLPALTDTGAHSRCPLLIQVYDNQPSPQTHVDPLLASQPTPQKTNMHQPSHSGRT